MNAMLTLFYFLLAIYGSLGAICNIKDPRSGQMSECRGDYCTLTRLLTLPAKEHESPTIVQGCINGTGIDDQGCIASITNMDSSQYCISIQMFIAIYEQL